MSHDDATALRKSYKVRLEDHLSNVASYIPSASMLEDQWSGMVWPASKEADSNPDTGVDNKTLEHIGRASVAVPDGFVCSYSFVLSSFYAHRFLSIIGNSSQALATRQAPPSKP